jgi:hypothetical protein
MSRNTVDFTYSWSMSVFPVKKSRNMYYYDLCLYLLITTSCAGDGACVWLNYTAVGCCFKPYSSSWRTAKYARIFRRVHKITNMTISFVMSFCRSVSLPVCLSVRQSVYMSAWNNSPPTERIFVKFDISIFFENLLRKVTVH